MKSRSRFRFLLRPCLLLACGLTAAAPALRAQSASPEWTDIAYEDQALMGDWLGEWVDPPEDSYQEINPNLAAQVINIGVGRYRVVFRQELDRRAHVLFEAEANAVDGKIAIDEGGWNFVVAEEGLSGEAQRGKHLIRLLLKRVTRMSPTLGMAAPEGALVLFDGSGFEAWQHADGRAVTWKLVGDGAMEVNPAAANKGAEPPIGGDIRTQRGFKDVQLHMEFRYPVEAEKASQGRGNSGLFFQGVYEVQILNSYGLAGYWNECGALYKHSPPKVNAARPPMQWQTYDVIYRAARFEEGILVENPRITVRLNGVLVHNDQEIIHHTAHRLADRDRPVPEDPGPIRLQDHSNRIQFRNIWVVELD